MVSPEALTEGSLNHKHTANTAIDTVDTNSQVDNSNTNIRITESVKQPSYLNLACCISGYTNLTTYNSKQREGFRSRDISPARITGVSPHAADDANNPAVFTSTCGNFLTPQPRYLTDMDHRKKSGDNMWNGNGNSVSPAASKVSTSTFTSFSTSSSTSTVSGTSSSYRCETRREVSSKFHTDSVTSHSREVPMPASSFIVQRVERLYGPGALAQGFYTRRSQGSSPRPLAQKEAAENEVGKDMSESPLPVLKLLTPAFRAQLTLAKRKSSSPSPVSSPNRALDITDGAVERVIPVKNLAIDEKDKLNKNEERETGETANIPIEKNGHFYLKMVLEESAKLEALAGELEPEISSVPEYMEGRLRAAAGKARLLANQKLAQFKGLCHKNINQDLTENFPTTCEDLAGFWDMVSIQINNVHEEFEQIDKLRRAGWPEQETVEKNGKKAGKEVVSNGNSTRSKSAPAPVKNNAASKARDEARKKLLAERRKAMRQNQTNPSEDVVIV